MSTDEHQSKNFGNQDDNVQDIYKNIDNDNIVNTSSSVSWLSFIKNAIFNIKLVVWFLCSLMTFGSYFTQDFPGTIGTGPEHTIQALFHAHGLKYTQTMNGALYSAYSYPNFILSIVGGLLIDKFLGLRKSILLFELFVFLGTLLFAIGVTVRHYWLLVLARLVFGMGGESLTVASNAIMVRYFSEGRILSFAFSIGVAVVRGAATLNFVMSIRFAKQRSVEFAAFVGVIITAISFISGVLLVFFDVYVVRKGLIRDETGGKKETAMKFKDILKLSAEFWLLCGVCVFNYGCILPFMSIGKNFLQAKNHLSGVDASTYLSLYQIIAAVMLCVSGIIVSAVGYFGYWLIFTSTVCLILHIFLITLPLPPATFPVLLGIIYSFLVASVWPAVAYVVRGNMVGLAYGIMTALQNISLATIPLVASVILDKYTPSSEKVHTKKDEPILPTYHGYQLADLTFIGSVILSLACAVSMSIIDKVRGGLLTINAKNATARLQEARKLEQREFEDNMVE